MRIISTASRHNGAGVHIIQDTRRGAGLPAYRRPPQALGSEVKRLRGRRRQRQGGNQ